MPALQELLQKADSYKQKISSARPLAKEELKSLDDYFRIGFTYSSNALEGNTLTISETKILLEDGITVAGRPLKDCYEAGQYRTVQVYISGTEYVPPDPDEVPRLMAHLADQIHFSWNTLHPVELAAMAHKRLVDIHPFIDGNGRTARLLMNLILVNAGYGVVSIPPVLRNDYINALSASRRLNDMEIFSKLIAECVIETQRDYCRLLKL